MTPTAVDDYVRRMTAMDGWFWPAAAYLFAWIDERQRRAGVVGDIFEIGVYHGKSAALLAAFLRNGERLGVCDLFGAVATPGVRPNKVAGPGYQGHSPNGSPLGFQATFLDNMRQYAPSDAPVDVYRGSSAGLSIEDTGANCRIVHIDGGHESADVRADLAVSDRALTADGVVVLDDFHNFAWPGVSEGYFQFMHECPGRFAPLAIGFNKGILCRPAAHADWRRRFTTEPDIWSWLPRGPFDLKTTAFCGHDTYIFNAPSRRSPDMRRTLLTTLHQHRPRFADRIADMLNYHDQA